jgi:hypothetical protein
MFDISTFDVNTFDALTTAVGLPLMGQIWLA